MAETAWGRRAPVALSVLFRSQTQAAVLTDLYLTNAERTLSELAVKARASKPAVSREVNSLQAAGLVTTRTAGRTRLVRACAEGREGQLIAQLVLHSYGPLEVVRRAFAGLGGIERLEIYGSWAARYHGEQGPPPADVDVLVVGTPDAGAVYGAADEASRVLALEVNPHFVTSREWEQADSTFMREVRDRPRVQVALGEDGAER